MLTRTQILQLGFNETSDKSLLPIQYQYEVEPFYKGDGQLSVSELEKLLKKFVEYTHQQKLIKGKLMEHILETRLKTINNEET